MAIYQLEKKENGRRNPGVRLRMGKPTKFQSICGRLTDLAYELGPDAKLPTVLQLREQMGVSMATLNSVLTELETQRVVRRRHGVGIYVSPDIRQNRICLICDPSFFRVSGISPFWGILVEKVRCRAEKEHEAFSFHFSLDVTEDNSPLEFDDFGLTVQSLPEALSDDIRNGRIDGVLGVGLSMATSEWIQRQNVPFVGFAGPGQYIFVLDSEESIRQGTTALCEAGCQRIGFWSPVAPHRYTELPFNTKPIATFEEALTTQGRVFDSSLVWDNQHLIPAGGGIQTLSHQEQGYHGAMEAFGPHTDRAEWPDGIYSTDDMLTQGLLTGLQRLGVRVGEEIKIVTHANIGSPVLLGWEDRITRLEVDPSEIVEGMFDILETLMHGQSVVPGETRVKTRLRLKSDA